MKLIKIIKENICFSLFLLMICGFISICSYELIEPKDFDKSFKKIYIDKLYMNEKGRYTVISNNKNGNPISIKVISRAKKIDIFTDVPKNERCYIKYNKRWAGGYERYDNVYIHIHSPNDINGGGWNHGKFGKGQTLVIE